MLMRLLFLVLGFSLLSAQASGNTFIGNKRKQVPADAYPFRAVVTVHPTKESKAWCSGFLIGPRHVKTSIHCLKDANYVPFKKIYVSITSNKYPGLDRPFLVKNPLKPGDIGKVGAVDDQYTLILDEDIGNELGYFGVNINERERPGFHGRLDDSDYIPKSHKEFCADSYKEPINFINFLIVEDPDRDYFDGSSVFADKVRVCTASYPKDKSISKVTVEDTCGIADYVFGAMVTNCSVPRQSSGGALFYREGDQYFAYGVLSKGMSTKEVDVDDEDVRFGDSYFNLATILEDEDLYLVGE